MRAELAPNALRYQLLAWAGASAATIILLPVLPVTLPLVWLYYRRYYASLDVTLTTRELQVSRGVLIRQEKTIPLEKITDLAVFQGPIMRRLGLKGIQVETAGQSGAGSALVKIVGLANVDDFRDAALDQRDKVTDRAEAPAEVGSGPGPEPALEEIHRTLLRIEGLLERKASAQ
jgi:putative membrane protein